MRNTDRPFVAALSAKALVVGEPVTIAVFVPNCTWAGAELLAADWATWVGLVARALCEVGGGCTRIDGEGYWVNPDPAGPALIRETTAILTCHCSRAQLTAGASRVRHVLWQYGRECEQHTVAFRLDGELFGIDPRQPY